LAFVTHLTADLFEKDMLMQAIQQIVPISHLRTEQDEILTMMDKAPVILAQRSKARAVLVSVNEWNKVAEELRRFRFIAEARAIAARNDEDGSWVDGDEVRYMMAERGVHVED